MCGLARLLNSVAAVGIGRTDKPCACFARQAKHFDFTAWQEACQEMFPKTLANLLEGKAAKIPKRFVETWQGFDRLPREQKHLASVSQILAAQCFALLGAAYEGSISHWKAKLSNMIASSQDFNQPVCPQAQATTRPRSALSRLKAMSEVGLYIVMHHPMHDELSPELDFLMRLHDDLQEAGEEGIVEEARLDLKKKETGIQN